MTMRLVLISDTHTRHRELELPDGDVLIHAGDFTNAGTVPEVSDFARWMRTRPHAHKVVIAGNHDLLFERNPIEARRLMADLTYLEDTSTTIDGIHFYGSPWQPWFYDWAFNVERGPAIREKWDKIPSDVDVLITHGPPSGHGDVNRHGDAVGCEDLLAVVRERQPTLHVYGHIHEGRGITHWKSTTFINASSVIGYDGPLAEPVVFAVD